MKVSNKIPVWFSRSVAVDLVAVASIAGVVIVVACEDNLCHLCPGAARSGWVDLPGEEGPEAGHLALDLQLGEPAVQTPVNITTTRSSNRSIRSETSRAFRELWQINQPTDQPRKGRAYRKVSLSIRCDIYKVCFFKYLFVSQNFF